MNFFHMLIVIALVLAIFMDQSRANWIDDIGAEVEKAGKEVEEMGRAVENMNNQFLYQQ
ncbi:sarcotoxin-1A [Drosophila virilis]|uniref:Uncharacterized protein n=1 Tax=Drosophila virilis TaxID=7244 RepID=A0A0Q9W3V4_DROVI|nr:sarcotoxin-1A [Drosophila virilis]KRF79645.1 uncharacterized protein Dvir_GJ26034 [Drosophila virilis]